MDRKGSRKKAPAEQAEVTERTQAAPPPAPRVEPPPAPRMEPARVTPPVAPAPRVDPLRRTAPVAPPPARPGLPARSPASPSSPRSFFSPIIETAPEEEVEHRHFPRARLATNFELWIDDGEGARRFTATLRSANVSVGGAFVESTFFLPLDTELRVRFSLEQGGAPVEARARIVREQRARREEETSGFGIRFEEFYGQTEVSLARLFLDMRLRTFAEEYLRSNRARGLPNELERVVDALAAWELLKANNPSDTWRGE
ncbi:PilZ domain-containing protein [Vitiosangium sp. GDMCC 1.1324]|uniref:PilZ domain-containing protein n=1 Tax=Vitiosangium sp. (strain GDMCC 1.1324) TaxID=2138576 RepID=UPI000D379B48|nr:PilZ domain-containing protein [Vitiosangium sp. GDMCC 1.1324]PTL77537.1 PilZ domain-containing protein [Vitiosangium sp. GDMCC 1.1324]